MRKSRMRRRNEEEEDDEEEEEDGGGGGGDEGCVMNVYKRHDMGGFIPNVLHDLRLLAVITQSHHFSVGTPVHTQRTKHRD